MRAEPVGGVRPTESYEPPAIARMGTLEELTKTVVHNSGNGNPWSF